MDIKSNRVRVKNRVRTPTEEFKKGCVDVGGCVDETPIFKAAVDSDGFSNTVDISDIVVRFKSVRDIGSLRSDIFYCRACSDTEMLYTKCMKKYPSDSDVQVSCFCENCIRALYANHTFVRA